MYMYIISAQSSIIGTAAQHWLQRGLNNWGLIWDAGPTFPGPTSRVSWELTLFHSSFTVIVNSPLPPGRLDYRVYTARKATIWSRSGAGCGLPWRCKMYIIIITDGRVIQQ